MKRAAGRKWDSVAGPEPTWKPEPYERPAVAVDVLMHDEAQCLNKGLQMVEGGNLDHDAT